MSALLNDRGALTAQAVTQLREHADMLECECPHHLLGILEQVRAFEKYTTECIARFPEDAGTHQWLLNAAFNIDTLLSATVVQLARIEGFVDAKNELIARPE